MIHYSTFLEISKNSCNKVEHSLLGILGKFESLGEKVN